MLADMGRWAEFNAVYLCEFDPDRLPARLNLRRERARARGEVEIECVASGQASGSAPASRPVGDELDVDVAARRVAIGADLLVRLLRQRLKLRLG